jgi:hypothetical protein
MLIFNKYFYKSKKSKLYFGDRVAVLNDFIYQTGGSSVLVHVSSWHFNFEINSHATDLVMQSQVVASRKPILDRVLAF